MGNDDTIIDAVIGRTAATCIMSFAKQVAGGRVGCLREQWRGQLQVGQVWSPRIFSFLKET